MIEESARVISSDNGFAIVETQTRAACGSCSAEQGCSTSVVAGLFKRRENRLRVFNPIHAEPGQQVVIGLQEQSLIKVSLAAYLLPLLCLILFSLAAQQAAYYWQWADQELSSILGGLFGLTVGLGLLKRFTRRRQDDPAYQPVILRPDISQPVQFSGVIKQ